MKTKADIKTVTHMRMNFSLDFSIDSSVEESELSDEIKERLKKIFNDNTLAVEIKRVTRDGNGIIQEMTVDFYNK